MIIVREHETYIHQDIEWTLRSGAHPALRAGGTAAFAVEIHGEERLVVVQETERNRDPGLAEEVIAAIPPRGRRAATTLTSSQSG